MMVEIVEFILHKGENIHKDLAHYIVRQINYIHDYRFTIFHIILDCNRNPYFLWEDFNIYNLKLRSLLSTDWNVLYQKIFL